MSVQRCFECLPAGNHRFEMKLSRIACVEVVKPLLGDFTLADVHVGRLTSANEAEIAGSFSRHGRSGSIARSSLGVPGCPRGQSRGDSATIESGKGQNQAECSRATVGTEDADGTAAGIGQAMSDAYHVDRNMDRIGPIRCHGENHRLRRSQKARAAGFNLGRAKPALRG